MSIAGVREKTALLKRRGGWYEPLGAPSHTHPGAPLATNRDNGHELVSGERVVLLADRLRRGFAAAADEIMGFGDTKALVADRFDRRLACDMKSEFGAIVEVLLGAFRRS